MIELNGHLDLTPDCAKYQRPKFARKQLRSPTDQITFETERDNLQLIQTLKNKHVIQIFKSYRHGDELNFLFPLAEGSLSTYLGEVAPDEDIVEPPYWTHWLWDQMAGVADALASLYSFSAAAGETGTPNSTWYGYHLDLKPSNILIQGTGNARTLVITDFGQACFRMIGTEFGSAIYSAITPNPGGTTYAPPDQQVDSSGHIHRSFDVWSFGCILLEVAVFIIQGQRGLVEFRNDRRSQTTLHARGTTACFYRLEGRGFEVKQAVLNRIETLETGVDHHQFITGILKLVREIFQSQADRPTARDVADDLKCLLRLRDSTNGVFDPTEREQATRLGMQDGDCDIGDDELKDM